MGALSFRLPDTKHQRLKELAKSKGMSINHLLEEAITLMLAEFDLKTQFEIRANRGRNNVGSRLSSNREVTLGCEFALFIHG
jgi:predicted DNA-binding protein